MAEDDNRAVGLLAAGAGLGLWWLLRRPSANFTWAELTQTSTGLDNTPTLEDRIRLIYLARRVLEPLRTASGALNVTSAFRSPAVNAHSSVQGSATSYHLTGLGIDLYSSAWDGAELAEYLYSRTDLPLAEVIVYPDSPTGRIHIAADLDGAPGARKFLTSSGGDYATWTP
jgi:hypothetical protein